MSAASDFPSLHGFEPQDLNRVLQFVGECCALTDFCGCFHPGDICHFISNTLRGRDPSQHLFLTEDGNGQINALVWIYPVRISGFEVMIHPNQRGGDLETRLIEWAENAVTALLQVERPDSKEITTEFMDGDLARDSALRQRGFEPRAQPSMMLNMRSLDVPIPESVLPEGYTIRSAAGVHEAALLAEVHSGAFNSNWTADEYARVMQSPAFEIERELVVVAPDGRFAAFLIYWIDQVSKSGLFEPVGCHPDFQRKGLTRALIYEGMRRMTGRGMETALVINHTDNPASKALYASAGFSPKYSITDFRKTIQ